MSRWRKWLTVPNALPLPQEPADAIFCPTYNLVRDGVRLTAMSEEVAQRAIDLFLKGRGRWIIFSIAGFGPPQLEKELKYSLLTAGGGDLSRTSNFTVTTNTYDEVRKTLKICAELCAKSLLVVAEQYHMPRILDTFQRLAVELKLYHVSVPVSRYEEPLWPSWIQRFTMASRTLWILRQVLLYHLAPLLLRRRNH